MNKLAIVISVVATAISTAVLILLWTVPGEIKGINTQIKGFNTQIEQQSMLLHRALGKIIPYTLPSDIESQMAAIEKQLTEESNWPKSLTDVQKLNGQLADLVDSLPPWGQEELLSRIAPRRWEIDTLWILANEHTDKDIDKYAKAVELALLQKPDNASNILEDQLKKRQKEIDALIEKTNRASAIETAKLAIEGKGDLEEAAKLLNDYDGDEAKALSAKLRDKILSKAFANSIEGLKNELEKYDAIDEAELKEYSFARSHQATQDIRLRMVVSGLSDKKLKEDLAALEKRIADNLIKFNRARQQRDAEKLKQYQVWALQKIKLVRPYKVVDDEESKKLSLKDRMVPGRVKKYTDAIVRNELIINMSSINQGLLDEAVSQWFRIVYQQRFEQLGEAEQLEVRTAFATATKKPLE